MIDRQTDKQIMNQENNRLKHLAVSGVRKYMTFTCTVCGSLGRTKAEH